MFNDLKELFDEIQFQQEKIEKFQKLLKANKYQNIQIHFLQMANIIRYINQTCHLSWKTN